MADAPTVALVALVLCLGALLHSSIGFGAALFAMPLLVFLIDVPTATPLVALAMLTSIVVTLIKTRRHVELGSTWRLVVATALGIPVGLLLLARAPEDLVRMLLGVVLVCYASYSLVGPRLPVVSAIPWAYGLGFVAGILGGAYNTNGPPVVLYGALQRWPGNRFRATLQGYFLPATLLVCAGHGFTGLWTGRVWALYLLSLPLVLFATFAGLRIAGAIPEKRFTAVLHAALMFLGVVLIF